MEIKIVKPTEEDLKARGVDSWPIWQKEASVFDWRYGDTEECYILEGKVTVSMKDGK
ncbi:MAG: DUF861 domain-containing protein, partial [Nitrospirae bacterium]|nr:DUF861 domain-containing protein [Nitrospirota bacterium]